MCKNRCTGSVCRCVRSVVVLNSFHGGIWLDSDAREWKMRVPMRRGQNWQLESDRDVIGGRIYYLRVGYAADRSFVCAQIAEPRMNRVIHTYYHMLSYVHIVHTYDLVRCNLLLHPLTNIDSKFEYDEDFWHFGKRMTLELLEFWKSQRCCCIGIIAYYKLFTDISYARAIL